MATPQAAAEESTQPATTLSAADIMRKAHEAAGGEIWVRPQSLGMSGHAIFYRDGKPVRHEVHNMWRVYDRGKTDAHRADGKVRIESIRNGKAVIDISYDGNTTYTASGPQPASAADQQWASAFGFGVGRHAFDPGYKLERLADDRVDGDPAHLVRITAPAGNSTLFWIAKQGHAILKIGFDTPRGWHERIYSDFFKSPGSPWQQPGRVRLYYNGIKANEVIWQAFEINQSYPDCLFVLPEAATCRTGKRLVPGAGSTLEADLAEMMRWFPGVYDNHRQVYRQAVEKVAEPMRQRHTHHIFQPVVIAGIPGPSLYAQQSQHYDRADLYRQRIYSFAVDEAEQAIRLTIYTPRDPRSLTDIHLDPARAATLTADDFILKPGCEVYWRKQGAQFEGYLKSGACSYFSQLFGKRVYLDETLTLRHDALILHDKAVDEAGKWVFGSADKGPTVNLKMTD